MTMAQNRPHPVTGPACVEQSYRRKWLQAIETVCARTCPVRPRALHAFGMADSGWGAYVSGLVPHITMFQLQNRNPGMRERTASRRSNGIHHRRLSGVSLRMRFQ